ncbi:MAG: lysine--tRNA ligase [Elusimicrobia bacterium]|nr:lysine--tRNA ligase [Elusimicrobiota bacterium]
MDEIIKLKTAKVRELRSKNVDPFPHRYEKRDDGVGITVAAAPLANEQHSGTKLRTAGRIMQLRLMGKAAFFHLQDNSGKAQAYIRLDTVGEQVFNHFRDDVQIGDFVGVEGEIFKTKTGEPTLDVKTLTLLAKALRPLPEKWHGLKDPETRYRQRHLDLVSNPEVRKLAEDRCRIVASVRSTMARLGYLEVETPILLPHAGGAAARPFATHHNALDTKMVLRIATELHLKRLVIGGMDRVFEIGRIFRNEGIDTRHNPEFTTLEAYGAYSDYHGMAALFENVLADAAKAIGRDSIEYRGQQLNLKPPFRRLYLPELWKQLCGADIHDILKGKGFDRQGLLSLAKKLQVEAGDATPSAKIFERIFDGKILPELVQPAFVMDHPTAITPLAKCKAGDESIVERFEFFVGTEELANAYTELNDPLDQRERFEEQARQRTSGDDETDILDEDFVQAMEAGMPPMGGIGIGIDRLVMILTGTPSIREVILFPTLKPEGAA